MTENIYRTVTINERLTLTEHTHGLAHGTDAFLLAAYTKSDPGKTAVEFGCGSGFCSLLCADRRKFGRIYAVDILPELVRTAKLNINNNRLDGIITAICADIRNSDAEMFGGKVSAVITNPPYFPAGRGRKSPDTVRQCSRHEENGGIGEFIAAASRILCINGSFVCVFPYPRVGELMSELSKNGFGIRNMTEIRHTADDAPSSVLVRAGYGEKDRDGYRTEPLVLFADGKPTAKAEKIYKTCDFGSISDE